tara:strand:- start:107 stop:361 length:255 start_codon:yes stop_codon:yes gene_type:complete
MICKKLNGSDGALLTMTVDGDKVELSIKFGTKGSMAMFMGTFKVEGFIDFGQSLTLNERGDFADQIKSDAITHAKLLRGDFNNL